MVLDDKFWSKVRKGVDNGYLTPCWAWLGNIKKRWRDRQNQEELRAYNRQKMREYRHRAKETAFSTSN